MVPLGAAQKEHGSHCKEEQGGRAPMWCHIGDTQMEHGSHCKGEQGGRAQIVVPHRSRTEITKVRIAKGNGEAGPRCGTSFL
jgi:hypothetical protein